MSAIPPNWLAGVLGAHGAQQNSEREKQIEAAAEAERVRASAFKESLRDAIRSVDQEDQVYEDAEGTGSQGRSSDQEPAAKRDDEDAPGTDDAGHIDVQA